MATATARRSRRQRFLDDQNDRWDDAAALAAIGLWASRHALLLDLLWQEAFIEGWLNFGAQFPTVASTAPATEEVVPDVAAMSLHKISVAKMTGELTGLVSAGASEKELGDWFDQNEGRIDQQADTLAWSAEQHGYQVAGGDKGLEIDWELEDGADHC